MTMNTRDPRADSELAELASRGNLDAATEIGRRHVAALYDFAIRVTLDQSSAQASCEASLNRSFTQLENRPPSLSYRAWLFGVARDECLEGVRNRGRSDDGAASPGTTLSAMDARFAKLAAAGEDEELALWAWQAARAQRPRDYSLLDLALRRQLAAEEIADIASLSRTGIYAVLGRLRGTFEETFATTVLYFRGRSECVDLRAVIGAADNLGPAVRREIGRHSEGCDICRATRGRLPLGADILGGLQNIPAPAALLALVAPPIVTPDAVEPAPPAVEPAAPELETPILLRDAVLGAAAAAAAGAGAALTPETPDAAPAANDTPDIEEPAPVLEPESEPPLVEATQELVEPEAELVAAPEAAPEAVEAIAEPEPLVDEPAAPVEAELPAVEAKETHTPVDLQEPVVEEQQAEPEGETAIAGAVAAASFGATDAAAEEPVAEEPFAAPEAAFEDAEAAEPVLGEPAMNGDAPVEAESMLGRLRGVFGRKPEAPVPEEEPVEGVYLEEMPQGFAEDEAPVEDEPGAEVIENEQPALAELDEAAIAHATLDDVEPVEGEAELPDPVEEPELEPVVAGQQPGSRSRGPLTGLRRGGDSRELATAGVAASSAAVVMKPSQARDGGPPHSTRPVSGGIGGEGGRRRIFVFTAIGAITLAAIYLGVAFGDSIRGGGEVPSVSVPALPTRAAGVREAACDSAPISVEQGSRATLTFDSQPLRGFEVAGVNVRAITPGATAQSVAAKPQSGLSVLFEAFPTQAGAARVDEYQLSVTFSRGSERTVSECLVLVTPAMAPTAVVPTQPPPPPPPTSPTVAPTQPPPTQAPVIVPTVRPTQPAPTLAPPTETPTEVLPPTATPTPTTEPTWTFTPTTRTATPTFTLTPLPSPTPTPRPSSTVVP